MILKGIAASDGIGLGRAVCLREESLDYSGVGYSGRETEKARLEEAMDQFNRRTSAMAESIRRRVGRKESEILTSQIAMLADPFLREDMRNAIDEGSCAEAAVDSVCGMYAGIQASLEDELMRQRAADIEDIRTRLLSILLGRESVDLSGLPTGSVLVVQDLTPSMTVGLKRENVAGILTAAGGRTSHSAILARALELPAVLGVTEALDAVKNGDGVIVDGGEGIAVLRPDDRAQREYLARREEFLAQKSALEGYRDRPTVDADGKRYSLYANIGDLEEVAAAARSGVEGVGLFRTEFLFMNRFGAPDEEAQYEAYLTASRLMAGKKVIIRTLDAGGDKIIACLGMEREENPFLGHRGIRYCLDHPELFKTQLRALLRAGAEGKNIKILLPLVTCVEEVRAARELLEQCKRELEEARVPYDGDIALGIMVETPAAVLTADALARECDFFSIGANDLAQYTMAADRGNPRVDALCSAYQPAVLRSIRSVITSARAAGIRVGMCGEAAADPRLTPLLMAWGLDGVSVNVSSVLSARAAVSRWSGKEAARVTQEVMALSTASDVEEYLWNAAAR